MVGRIVFGLPFIAFGVLHFQNAEMMAGLVPPYVAALGGGVLWVYVTGLVLIASGFALVANRYVMYAGYALTGFLLATTVLVHLPPVLGGNMNGAGNFLKDAALLGASLMLLGTVREARKDTAGSVM